NLFYDFYQKGLNKEPEWESFMFKASESKVFSDKKLASIKRQYKDKPEAYEQEYECSFEAAIKGAFYGQILSDLQRDGKLGKYPYNSKYPVITGWDLGYNDLTCIWFAQQVEGLI